MKFGIASLFSFRPHVEHMAFLAEVLRCAGHEISGFTCDAVVSHCYSRDLRGRSKLRECPTCIVGGIRSYPVPNVWSLDRRFRQSPEGDQLGQLARSSVATVHRTEGVADIATPDFIAAQRALAGPMEVVYGNARRWIESRRLDAVLFFNGRMDLTAALRAACHDLQIPYITVERSWFGSGLMLIPNQNCLGLGEIGRLSREFAGKPLLADQAAYAGRIAADRFRQRNVFEWRLYNAGAVDANWPNSAPKGARVLILPSSRNEFEGHPDYVTEWPDYTDAMAAALRRFGLSPRHCVVRCHPNWAERIGAKTGWRSERHYSEWARALGMTVIGSTERINTYRLIAEADYVIVNGSSTGVEAGLLGKKVVCVAHSIYEHAGFSVHVPGPVDLEKPGLLEGHDSVETTKRALRFVYTHGRRFTQFAEFVRPLTTARYEYFVGADAGRIERMCRSGQIEPDDGRIASDTTAEDLIVARVSAGDWESLGAWRDEFADRPRLAVRRRPGFRWVDSVRNLLPRGDL